MSAELIVAVDVASLKQARQLADRLTPRASFFKIGFQLFTACGPAAVALFKKRGGRVFLDLKFHDIPNTVASSMRAAAALGVDMCTLHISGGRAMIQAAKKAALDEACRLGRRPPRLIGVTVLTSQAATKTAVLKLAREGLRAGCDGVVCSVREAGFLRKKIRENFIIVTPGIRPAGVSSDDQKRTATVTEAVAAGSDFLVVGRPITAAPDPAAAAETLRQEMEKANKKNLPTKRCGGANLCLER